MTLIMKQNGFRNESRNESNIEAVYNMLVANVDESVVQRMYPEQLKLERNVLFLLNT